MENATKALLIAAAIIIAVVIITITVAVLGQGTTMVQENSDMSDVEVSAFNSKFEPYIGGNISGTKVKQLIKTVNQNNKSYNEDASKQITLKKGTTTTSSSGTTTSSSTWTKDSNGDYNVSDASSGEAYIVKDTSKSSSGLIKEITITQRQ